jgi:hypothetical protein
MQSPTRIPGILIATFVSVAWCQSDIDAAQKFAWGENVGWLNWRDAGSAPGAQGVRILVGANPALRFLSGFIWAENIGWIHVGDGTPVDGVGYANTNGTDFGVNVRPDGTLFGFTWGENVGWINFGGGELATPAKPARLDSALCRFRGFAWGENIGWISLDHTTHFVSLSSSACTPCTGDIDGDAQVGLSDLTLLLSGYGIQSGAILADGDLDGDGDVDLVDLATLLASYGSICT